MADEQPTTESRPAEATSAPGRAASRRSASTPTSDPFAERPEAFVGAAFAGGFVLALILRRLAR